MEYSIVSECMCTTCQGQRKNHASKCLPQTSTINDQTRRVGSNYMKSKTFKLLTIFNAEARERDHYKIIKHLQDKVSHLEQQSKSFQDSIVPCCICTQQCLGWKCDYNHNLTAEVPKDPTRKHQLETMLKTSEFQQQQQTITCTCASFGNQRQFPTPTPHKIAKPDYMDRSWDRQPPKVHHTPMYLPQPQTNFGVGFPNWNVGFQQYHTNQARTTAVCSPDSGTSNLIQDGVNKGKDMNNARGTCHDFVTSGTSSRAVAKEVEGSGNKKGLREKTLASLRAVTKPFKRSLSPARVPHLVAKDSNHPNMVGKNAQHKKTLPPLCKLKQHCNGTQEGWLHL